MELKFTTIRFLERKRILKLIMKTFLFLFCTTVFSFTSGDIFSQNSKIVVDADKTLTIDEVFEMIDQQTKYSFIYKSDLFDGFPSIELKKGVIRSNKLMRKILSASDFMVVLDKNNTIIIKEKDPLKKTVQKLISGKVTDTNGLPLLGVTVLIKGTNKGTSTNLDGKYSINANSNSTLLFTYIGYESQEHKVGDLSTINVSLIEQTSELDEVVLVGYGTTKKRDLTGSVGTIKSEEIKQVKTQSVDESLIGKISGVFVSSAGNQPGQSNIVYVRGLSQINGDNQPLYVVDGVPIIVAFKSLDDSGLASASTGNENPLLTINPNDIERIDVLKDASSAAIYGSRAANGVILITTKKGKFNQKPKFTYSTEVTIQNQGNKIDWLDGDEFRAIAPVLAQRVLDYSPYPASQASFRHPAEYTIVNDPDSYFRDGNTDWNDETIRKNALWTDHRFSVNGGTSKLGYLLSAGVSDQDGLIIYNNFLRYNISTSLDIKVNDKLKIGGAVSYNHSISNQPYTSRLQGADNFRPDFPIFNDDGTYTTYLRSRDLIKNPIGDAQNVTDKSISKNLRSNVFGEWEFIKNAKFRSEISVSEIDTDKRAFTPSTSGNPLLSVAGKSAKLTVRKQSGYTTTFNNTIAYNGKIKDDHFLDIVAGISYDKLYSNFEQQKYEGFPDDIILTNINSANAFTDASSEAVQSGLNSVFSRINYNYNDKYLATFTARSDASTKFGPGNQRGFFPSGALAWNIHNESFMQDGPLNRLKLRASLGRTGSDNLPSFSFLSYVSTLGSSSVYDDITGIALLGFPNPDIQWETTDQLDLGVEFGLFNNRFSGEVVYFEKNTSDLILIVPLAPQNGFANYNYNVGDMSNKGWEIDLNANLIKTNNFKWNSSFNISFIKNKVEALNGGTEFSALYSGIKEGFPIGYIEGFEVIGIAQTSEEIDALNAGAPNGVYYSTLLNPGDYIYKDANGDGEITNDDMGYLGDINPDYFGGWSNTLTYKDFDLTFNLQFVQGVDKRLATIGSTRQFNVATGLSSDVYDTWSPDNTNASISRFGSRVSGTNSKGVQDASYTRLRYAAIGYNLPNTLINKVGLQSARLAISANNLFTLTKYTGEDPESAGFTTSKSSGSYSFGASNGAYPVAKTFTLSLNISF